MGRGPGPARVTVAVAALAIAVAGTLPASAYPRPGRVERLSVPPSGGEPNGESFMAAPTPDGRYVAFQSGASNLVPGDTNDRGDIFVLDRARGTIERVSVASDGAQADAGSGSPSISADGRYVAFSSFATNLVPGGTSIARPDIFVHDRQTGLTERVSVSSTGQESDGWPSWEPSISADGRYVAFESWASNLVPGDTNGSYDVFVRDRLAGTTERVSVASDGTEGNSSSQYPDISADGRYVAFESRSRTLVLPDANNAADIFVHDRVTRTTERVSIGTDGSESNQASFNPVISADGRVVAFEGWGFNLVPGDFNRAPDVFVHDRQTGVTDRISVSSDGAEGSVNGHSLRPAIAPDGRHVAFHSAATNLVPGDTNAAWDVFVHDLATGATERVSVDASGLEGNGASRYPMLTAGGVEVLFESQATNIVPSKASTGHDIFARNRGSATGIGEIQTRVQDEEVSVSGWATFSGAVVSAAQDAPDLTLKQAGADIVSASVAQRPESEDLALRLRLASLPGPVVGGAPGIVYRWSFLANGVRHEVRALRLAATGQPSADASFALYRCDPGCGAATPLRGGIGIVGPEVRVSVPLASVGLGGGGALTQIEASTGPGEAAMGSLATFDDVSLPDAPIRTTTVEVGLAPEGTAEEDVEVEPAALEGGRFTAMFGAGALPPGPHRVWAKACHGEVCGVWSQLIKA